MNKLAGFRKFALTLILTLIGVNLWSQNPIEVSSWSELTAALTNNTGTFEIKLMANCTASATDNRLDITNGRTVTLDLNNKTIDRGLYNSSAVASGQVMKIASGCNVTIVGPGTIMGGNNLGSSESIDGGGIYNAGTLTLNNVRVYHNKCIKQSGVDASGRGGGIYCHTNSSFTMNGGELISNSARGGGGGIYGNSVSKFEMKGEAGNMLVMQENESESKGGAVRIKTNNCTAVLEYCEISLNSVTATNASQGGGVYMEGGKLSMINCEITGNSSYLQGAGFYSINGTTTATNCEISYNGAYGSSVNNKGAGVYIYAGSYTMNGGTITQNNSNSDGGGINVNKGAKLYLKGKINITDNYKVEWIYDDDLGMWYPNDETLTSSNVYITDNTSTGVIYILDGFDNESRIGVEKKYSHGYDAVFTSGLKANGGSPSNFEKDVAAYAISWNASETEAQLSQPAPWSGGEQAGVVDTGNHDYLISTPLAVVTGEVTANSISFSGSGCLIIDDGAILNVPTIINDDPVRLVIEDGGQVITNSGNVSATVRRDILRSTASVSNWYLISSAINNPNIITETNIVTTEDPTNSLAVNGLSPITYDLYRFNEAAALQWENYRAGHSDFTTLSNGRGYLYRVSVLQDFTIEMDGYLNVSNIYYPLSYSGTNELKGFNLIGNPYSHSINKDDSNANILNGNILESNYYMLETNGTWTLTNDGSAIPPLTGFLVQTKSESDLTITNEASTGTRGIEADNDDIWFYVKNDEFEDRACAEFKDGRGLNKIAHQNEKAPMLYINHKGEDFASVDLANDTKMFDLYFETKTTDFYTLSVNLHGTLSYLHLIDKLAGKDIDLNEGNEYAFVGSPMDDKDRFEIRLSPFNFSGDGNSMFAYQSGDKIVVSGEGELQVFDVMGRLVSTQRVNGVQMIEKPSTVGVYIMRLNDKTQKIVVR